MMFFYDDDAFAVLRLLIGVSIISMTLVLSQLNECNCVRIYDNKDRDSKDSKDNKSKTQSTGLKDTSDAIATSSVNNYNASTVKTTDTAGTIATVVNFTEPVMSSTSAKQSIEIVSSNDDYNFCQEMKDVDINDAITDELRFQSSKKVNKNNIGFKERLIIMFVSVKMIDASYRHTDTTNNSKTNYSLTIMLRPDAFCMLFFLGFLVYLGSASLVSTYLSDSFDLNNNLVRKTFGENNICIYFDDAPFTYVSAALWVPLMNCLLLFEIFDLIRTYN